MLDVIFASGIAIFMSHARLLNSLSVVALFIRVLLPLIEICSFSKFVPSLSFKIKTRN